MPVLTATTVVAVSAGFSTTFNSALKVEEEKRAIPARSYDEITPVPAKNLRPVLADTIKLPDTTLRKDTSILTDTLKNTADSLKMDSVRRALNDTFSLKISKDTIEAPVQYVAEDSAVGLMTKKTIILYGKAKADYQDMSLTAPVIELDQGSNILKAQPKRDSLGEIVDYAEMKQGQEEYKTEGLEYNFKTQKGISKGTITQQGEMYVHTEVAKKVEANTMYALGTFLTTCNLDHPHFGFRAKRAKIINQKLAVTGAVRPEFDSVPVPIYLPFGFYPLYQGRHSGFMAPSFETNDQRGLGLSRMGYYHVISQYSDVQLYGDVYSLGSWSLTVNPRYQRNYKYTGNLSLTYMRTQTNFKGDKDYSVLKNYSVTWSHSADMKARPGTTFMGSVNYATSRFDRNVPNNLMQNYNNQLGSSISYSKTWQNRPFNFTASANHSQTNSTNSVTLNIPDIGFTVSTLYPFQRKEGTGSKKWYEQLGVGYQGSFRNNMGFNDTVDHKKVYGKSLMGHLLDTLQWTANHSIPISLSLPPILGGAITVAPSISFSMAWVDRSSSFNWVHRDKDSLGRNRDTIQYSMNKGFYIKPNASAGLSFSTALFGTYQFRNKKVAAIRHVARPSLGLSYTPDFTKNQWESVQIDSIGTRALYNKLEASSYLNTRNSQFVSRKSGNISFGFDNNLEMKVRNKKQNPKDTTEASDQMNSEEEYRKVRIIEGFGMNTSYNIFADSMNLSPISIYFRTNLLEKINLSAGATLTPYQLNNAGYATSKYAWQGGKFSVGRITSANISMSTSFQSKPKDAAKEKKKQDAMNEALNDPMLQADQQRLMEYMRQNPSEFVDFNTPWSLSLSFSMSYSLGGYDVEKAKWAHNITAGTNFTGSFNLTPKWNFSVTGDYDFKTKKVQRLGMVISRDLHCWQLGINVQPIGLFRMFSFTINPKAGILQDLKINRTRSFSSQNY